MLDNISFNFLEILPCGYSCKVLCKAHLTQSMPGWSRAAVSCVRLHGRLCWWCPKAFVPHQRKIWGTSCKCMAFQYGHGHAGHCINTHEGNGSLRWGLSEGVGSESSTEVKNSTNISNWKGLKRLQDIVGIHWLILVSVPFQIFFLVNFKCWELTWVDYPKHQIDTAFISYSARTL